MFVLYYIPFLFLGCLTVWYSCLMIWASLLIQEKLSPVATQYTDHKLSCCSLDYSSPLSFCKFIFCFLGVLLANNFSHVQGLLFFHLSAPDWRHDLECSTATNLLFCEAHIDKIWNRKILRISFCMIILNFLCLWNRLTFYLFLIKIVKLQIWMEEISY